jgi:hypothetical protein
VKIVLRATLSILGLSVCRVGGVKIASLFEELATSYCNLAAGAANAQKCSRREQNDFYGHPILNGK